MNPAAEYTTAPGRWPRAGAATTIGTDEFPTATLPATHEGPDMAVSKAEPGRTRVGWIGTGVMGRWMGGHLLAKGYKATVYNRSRDKAGPLLDEGAAWADSPRAVAERDRKSTRLNSSHVSTSYAVF